MKEITYGDLLNCYNVLLEYAGTNRRRYLEGIREEGEYAIDNNITMGAKLKVNAAQEVIADFYFEGDTEAAQDAINAMAKYLDLEDRAAEALAEWAPPVQDERTVITW